MIIRILRRVLGPGDMLNPGESLAVLRGAANWTPVGVRAFYCFLVYYGFNNSHRIGLFRQLDDIDLLWPVAWASPYPLETVVGWTFSFALAAAILAVMAPGSRLIRTAAFLGLFQYMAFIYSFGKIGHSLHLVLFSAFLLIFLPPESLRFGRLDRRKRFSVALILGSVQAMILLSYSLAGLFKVGGAVFQNFRGSVHAFQSEALSLHVADRLLQTGSNSVLGDWVIANEHWVWPAFPLLIVIQCFSFVMLFRHAFHAVWGILLIGTHLGASLVLDVHFHENVFLLLLFLVVGPFHRTWSAAPEQ